MYFLNQDNDGHWYIIPSDRRDDWQYWLESDEYEMGDIPDWATQLGGGPNLVEFKDYEIV